MRHGGKNKDNRIFSDRYWKGVFLRILMASWIFAMVVTIMGVLALPVIMSLVYSWKWMFMYVLYLYLLVCILNVERKGD